MDQIKTLVSSPLTPPSPGLNFPEQLLIIFSFKLLKFAFPFAGAIPATRYSISAYLADCRSERVAGYYKNMIVWWLDKEAEEIIQKTKMLNIENNSTSRSAPSCISWTLRNSVRPISICTNIHKWYKQTESVASRR